MPGIHACTLCIHVYGKAFSLHQIYFQVQLTELLRQGNIKGKRSVAVTAIAIARVKPWMLLCSVLYVA